MWFTGEAKGKPLQYSCLEIRMNRMKRQNDRTLKGAPQVSRCPICYWISIKKNNSRKNEETSQSKNNMQLWMGLVMEVKSDAVKNSIA